MESQPYNINLNVKFGDLQLIDVGRVIQECTERWFNQTLCRVNDCVVRLGVLHGEFHWHKHDEEDEFFFVLEGRLLIDVGDETVALGPKQGYVVPKTVVHRTRAPERTAVLMIERASIKPTGD